MAGKILLEVVTPEKQLLSQQVDEVIAPGSEGEFGVLPGHCHFLSTLRIGELRYRVGDQMHHMAILWGYAEVTPNKVTVMAEIAEKAEDIDVGRAQAAVEQGRAASQGRRLALRGQRSRDQPRESPPPPQNRRTRRQTLIPSTPRAFLTASCRLTVNRCTRILHLHLFPAGRPVGFSCLVLAALVATSSPVPNLQPVGEQVLVRALSGEELLRIGEIHDVQNHFPEALTYYEQALQSFRARKQRKGEATVLTKIGSVFERQGRRQEAAVQLRQALNLFSKFPDSASHADALFLLAKVSFWVGSSEEASLFLDQAKEQYGRLQHAEALGSVKIFSGLLKVRDAFPDNGLRDIEQALENARSRRDHEQTVAALLALGDANFILERLEPAKSYYDQSLALLEQRPHAQMEAGLRLRLAEVHDLAGRPEQGVDFARRAVTLFQSLRDLPGEAAAWTLLAALHQALQHPQEAGEAREQALSIYRRQQMRVHAMRQSSPSTSIVPKESR